MTIDDIIQHYGSAYDACMQLGIRPQNVTYWRKRNKVPPSIQVRLQVLTKGELMASPECIVTKNDL